MRSYGVNTLLAFPCAADLVPGFLERVDCRGAAALLLAKQAPSLLPRLRDAGVTDCYVLPESMYGRITQEETCAVLSRLASVGARQAFFPISDFCGNSVPLLGLVSGQVTAVNATSVTAVRETAVLPGSGAACDRRLPDGLDGLQEEIVGRLRVAESTLRDMADGGRSGEKPTTGLLDGFPYDSETLYRYAVTPAEKLGARVLEIGCGLGFGAYLLSRLHPERTFVVSDIDEAAIAAARVIWQGPDNLSFVHCPGGRLPHPEGAFDAVLAYELIEHVDVPSTLLRECCSLLRPGGHLIGSTPVSSLFAYRVNTTGRADPGLRSEGIWPWHLQEFDEDSLAGLLRGNGFIGVEVSYPTYETGLDMFGRMAGRDFATNLGDLKNLTWNASDFGLRPRRVPCFSGSSFVFCGRKP